MVPLFLFIIPAIVSRMEFIAIKTRRLTPPQDDLLAIIDEELTTLIDGDIVVVSSKVVAIHEGRCVPHEGIDKKTLIEAESDFIIPRTYWGTPLSVKHHTFLGTAGIDESNGNGFLILSPEDPFASAQMLHSYIKTKCNLKKLGVIISDSYSKPFRFGAMGVALAWWGMEPLQDHRGRADLFGRAIKIERSNLVDGIAAGATVVAGEVDECIPIVVARNVQNVTYVEGNTKEQLFSPYKDDTFRVIYEDYLPDDLRE